MLISICYITIPVLILIQSVNSVDLYKSKRVIRNPEEIKTPYNSNHPPLQEQHIPVSVIYDDEEDIRILTKSTKETTQSIAGSKVILPSSIRNSDKPIVLTLKSQFVNGPPAAEIYETIPVVIVTDDVEEKTDNNKNDGKSVSKVSYQEKVIISDKSTDSEEPKVRKLQGQSMKIETTTSSSDTNVNATVSNVRPLSQRRRLLRVTKTKVVKDQTSRNDKTDKTPAAVIKNQTSRNDKTDKTPAAVVKNQSSWNDKTDKTPAAVVKNLTSRHDKTDKTPAAVVKNQTSRNDKTNKTPAAVVKNQTSRNDKTDKTPAAVVKNQTSRDDRTDKIPAAVVKNQSSRNDKTDKTPAVVVKNQTSRNEKTYKTPAAVAKDQTNENPKNNSQPSISSQFPKRTEQPDPIVPIVDSENYVYAYNGDYHYSYEGGDGTKAYEKGELRKTEGGSSGNGVVGGFSYTDNEGNDFSLSYTADENGYRPIGAHLPTPPPIPPAIQRALDILATKTTPEPITERVNKLN